MEPIVVAEIAAALLYLAAYALAQFGKLRRDGYPYLLLNFVGTAVLAAIALVHQEWGFLFLNGAWALVSAGGLAALVRARRTPAPP